MTWQNKWLWVAGLVLASLSSGGGSGGGNFGSSSSGTTPSSSPTPIQIPDNIEDKTSYVLGIATNYLENWFFGVSSKDWVMLAIVLVCFFVVGIAANWVITSWAKGALILGFEDANNNKVVTLKSISPYGLANIKKLIIFGLISFLATFVLTIGLLLVVGVGYLFSILLGTAGTILLVLIGILAFLVFLVLLVIFVMITIYAERLIVLKGFSPWNAWKKGFSLSKGNFFPTIIMGIINSIVGFATGCLGILISLIVFSIPAYLLIAPMFEDGFIMPNISQLVGILVLILLFMSINIAIRAVFVVFNYGNWNLFFRQVFLEKEELKNE